MTDDTGRPATPSAFLRFEATTAMRNDGLRIKREQLKRENVRIMVELVKHAKRERRKQVALSHPILFGMVYMPSWFGYPTPPFHWHIVNQAMRCRRYAVAAPTGSGKTVLLTKVLPVWSIFAEEVQEALLISNSNTMASGWLDQVRMVLESSEELKEDFGSFQGSHWGSEDLEFIFRDGRSFPRRMIKARGKGCAIRGLHPDRIMLDDPQDEESLKTGNQVEEFEAWVKGALMTRLDTSKKKLTYIGTTVTPDAYIVSLITNPPAGWVTEAYGILDEHGRSRWPEKFPEHELAERRIADGEQSFQANYMNAPLRHVMGRGMSMEKVGVSDHREVGKESFFSLCLDPSFTVGGDAWALTAVEQTVDRAWHVLEAVGDRTGVPGWLDALFVMYHQYGNTVDIIGIEAGTGGQGSVRYLIEERERAEAVSLPITWLTHTTRRSKAQRIDALWPLLEHGRVYVRPGLQRLRHEMASYRSGRANQEDNFVDSLAMHLEVQQAKSPQVRPVVTREAAIHDHARRMERIREELLPAPATAGRGLDRYAP